VKNTGISFPKKKKKEGSDNRSHQKEEKGRPHGKLLEKLVPFYTPEKRGK